MNPHAMTFSTKQLMKSMLGSKSFSFVSYQGIRAMLLNNWSRSGIKFARWRELLSTETTHISLLAMIFLRKKCNEFSRK